jgi:hypothetical protein
MPKARCAPSGWLRYLATAGDHAGDVTDGQHAPNADSARCPGWFNGVTYGMQIIPSALLPTTGRLAGQEKARVVRKRRPGMSQFRVVGLVGQLLGGDTAGAGKSRV